MIDLVERYKLPDLPKKYHPAIIGWKKIAEGVKESRGLQILQVMNGLVIGQVLVATMIIMSKTPVKKTILIVPVYIADYNSVQQG